MRWNQTGGISPRCSLGSNPPRNRLEHVGAHPQAWMRGSKARSRWKKGERNYPELIMRKSRRCESLFATGWLRLRAYRFVLSLAELICPRIETVTTTERRCKFCSLFMSQRKRLKKNDDGEFLTNSRSRSDNYQID